MNLYINKPRNKAMTLCTFIYKFKLKACCQKAIRIALKS